jgi:hypothetical protein
VQHGEYGIVLPQAIDFSVHILRLCEEHCKLVSSSGVLRVDLGIEFLHCRKHADDSLAESEEHLRARQQHSELWHSTGAGFLVRFFVNEVTSTLDINWSAHTARSKRLVREAGCGTI